MHVSQNNNDYSLARRTLETALGDAGCNAETLCGYPARLTPARSQSPDASDPSGT